jgi:hypothetical protein
VDINTFSWVLFADPHLVQDPTGLLHIDFDTTIPSDHRTAGQMAKESRLYWAGSAAKWLALPLPDDLAQLDVAP